MARQLIKYEEIECENGNQVARARFENGHTVTFMWDHDTESPRNWDPMGTMAMWHRRYDLPCEGTLTNKPDSRDFQDWCAAEEPRKTMSGKEATENVGLEWVMMYGEYTLDHAEKELEFGWQVRMLRRMINYVDNNYVWSYVGMYDHSGLSFSHQASYRYGDWDSGIVGCHYVSLEKLRKEYKKLRGNKLWARGRDVLDAELNEYDNWQMGSVVWFKIEDADGDEVDSCGGYIVDRTSLDFLIEEVLGNFGPEYFVDEEQENNNE